MVKPCSHSYVLKTLRLLPLVKAIDILIRLLVGWCADNCCVSSYVIHLWVVYCLSCARWCNCLHNVNRFSVPKGWAHPPLIDGTFVSRFPFAQAGRFTLRDRICPQMTSSSATFPTTNYLNDEPLRTSSVRKFTTNCEMWSQISVIVEGRGAVPRHVHLWEREDKNLLRCQQQIFLCFPQLFWDGPGDSHTATSLGRECRRSFCLQSSSRSHLEISCQLLKLRASCIERLSHLTYFLLGCHYFKVRVNHRALYLCESLLLFSYPQFTFLRTRC